MIDPGKFAAWQKRYANALRELPPDLKAKFSNAASASDAVADAAEARKGAIDGYQKSVAGKFLKLDDPADITKTVSGIFGAKDAVRQMSTLARQARAIPKPRRACARLSPIRSWPQIESSVRCWLSPKICNVANGRLLRRDCLGNQTRPKTSSRALP